ncbi:MAG: hypothetical protein JNM17_14745 [Archangium sp.]|nr:hypothetical protein [Archangium sp.]
MRRALIIAAALTLVACGEPNPTRCCVRQSSVARAETYVTTMAAPDGGAPTEVRIFLGDAGTATITFLNGGHEIVQTFDVPQ